LNIITFRFTAKTPNDIPQKHRRATGKSVIKMQDPDKADEYITTASAKPSLLLKGEQPRLVDE
jgi:hypothetical protein